MTKNEKRNCLQKVRGLLAQSFLKMAPVVMASSLGNSQIAFGQEENDLENGNCEIAQMLNDSFEPSFERVYVGRLSDEEILQSVLFYCQTSDVNFINLANHIVANSNVGGVGYQNYMEVAHIFYEIAQIPVEEKLNAVLFQNGINQSQLDVVASVVSAEAKKTIGNTPCYIDSYGVINNIDSRSKSLRWVSSCGPTLYHQVVARGQYAVYPRASSRYLGNRSTGYLATIDFLYAKIYCKEHGLPLLTPERCLQFRSKARYGRIQFVAGGNNFFDVLSPYENMEVYVPYIRPQDYIASLHYKIILKNDTINSSYDEDLQTLSLEK